MTAIIAFITLVVNEVIPLIPTISADAALAVSLISGARTALSSIGSSSPAAVSTTEFQALDASVAQLETQWASQLAAAAAAQGPVSGS